MYKENKVPLIKVGFCVAYDWEYLKVSLPLIYDYADKICISIDINRISWSGHAYTIEEKDFRNFLVEIDKRGIIDVYEEVFFLPQITAIENDTRQRQMMASRLGEGGWHLQIDSDEYFIDFENFVTFLRSKANLLHSEKVINICCFILPLFKKLPDGFLIVKNRPTSLESFQIATNKPCYEQARRNGHFNYIAPFFLIHQTWARSEQEVWSKINSWGHENDFVDKNAYYDFWLKLDKSNYKTHKNFHPLSPTTWESLQYVHGTTIEEAMIAITTREFLTVPKWWLMLNNSKVYLKLRQLLKF